MRIPSCQHVASHPRLGCPPGNIMSEVGGTVIKSRLHSSHVSPQGHTASEWQDRYANPLLITFAKYENSKVLEKVYFKILAE